MEVYNVCNNKVNFYIYQGEQGAKGERGAVGAEGRTGNGTSCDCMGKQTALVIKIFVLTIVFIRDNNHWFVYLNYLFKFR